MPTVYQRKKRQGFMLYHEDVQYLSFFDPSSAIRILVGLAEVSRALAEGNEPPDAPAQLSGIELHTFNTMAKKIKRDHDSYAQTCEARSRRKEHPPNIKGDLSLLKASNSSVTETETVAVAVPGSGNVYIPAPGDDDIQAVCEELHKAGIHGKPFEEDIELALSLLRKAPYEWIKEACNRACGQGSQAVEYVHAILNNWRNIGRIDAPTKAAAYRERLKQQAAAVEG